MTSQTSTVRPSPARTAPQTEEERRAVETLDQYAERLAMRFSIAAGALMTLLVLVLNWGDDAVPLMQDRQGFGILTLYAAPLLVALAAGSTYVLGLRAYNARVAPEAQQRWPLAAIPVGLGYGLVTAFLVALSLQLSEMAFTGLVLAPLQAAVITGAATGALVQMFARAAARMNTVRILQLAVMAIAAGVYATAALVDNPEWWRISFSYLGSLESNARAIFNITLTFGGLLILAWLPYMLNDLRVLIAHGIARPAALRYFNIGLIWMGIGIALVGIFKTQADPVSHIVHNLAAYSLAALFGILFLFFKRVVPGASPELLTLTWVLVGALAVTLIFAALGYFNTVGLEIICFALGLTWLQSMTSFIHAEAMRLDPARNPE